MNIRDKIITKLKQIEEKEQVRILYAVESGSRAWGFESQDSDFDVRFIYTHSIEWYLSIEEKRDVIEYPMSNRLDFSGWDIKKALQLYKKSNPPLYEWLLSPIVYIEDGEFTKKLRTVIPQYYSLASSIHHYLHMAKGNYRDYLKRDKVKVKKYFYVLRPIFACMWIKSKNTIPPMEFEKLLYSQRLDMKLRYEIEKLLKRKKEGIELDLEPRIEVINKFLEKQIDYFEKYAEVLKTNKPKQYEVLNDFFRKILEKYSAH